MNRILMLSLIVAFISSCNPGEDTYVFEVENSLDMDRNNEAVTLKKDDFRNMTCELFERLSVLDGQSGEYIPSQLIDEDMDGTVDVMVFIPVISPGETREYKLIPDVDPSLVPKVENETYSRFVPERIDDYAWENNRVAFRTYGPEAQRLVEDGERGGTLSSGIDCWLKKVEYPIINKWYRKPQEGGSYHNDDGEGLDNYHVGASRGCGGSGIWVEAEQKLYTSKNFETWSTVSEGPLRTQFELDYSSLAGPDGIVSERKVLSLDMGSQMTRFEIHLEGNTSGYSAGLTLHENDGDTYQDEDAGWFSYWQPHEDSELGMGIVVPEEYLAGYTKVETEETDQSNFLVHLRPVGGIVVYYAGFSWKESGQYTDAGSWNQYLETFARQVDHPLKYKVTE